MYFLNMVTDHLIKYLYSILTLLLYQIIFEKEKLILKI